MQKVTKTFDVFDYSELSDKAKDKAKQTITEYNTDYDWWFPTVEYSIKDDLAGIGITNTEIYFDLYNGTMGLDNRAITDVRKFLKFCNIDLRTKEAREALENGLYIKNCNKGNECYIELGWSDHEELTKCLYNKLNGYLHDLQTEMDYLESEGCVVDTIEANEYKFLESGEIFQG